MKVYKDVPAFPLLRRAYKSYADLGAVINRSQSYINNCLNGRRCFTELEKRLILSDMGLTIDQAGEVFNCPEVVK